MNEVEETYKKLDAVLRSASIAQIGGFRPPLDRLTSWFGGSGVGNPDENRPSFKGKDMFSLLQVKVSELPIIPDPLKEIAFLTVFMNRQEIPFERFNGDGWLIRVWDVDV